MWNREALVEEIEAVTSTMPTSRLLELLLPVPVAIGASIVTLAVALRYMRVPDPPQNAETQTVPGGWSIIALRAAVSLLTAVGLLLMADRFGAAAGGAVGAYPIFTTTLCMFVFVSAGAIGVQRVLFGMVRGLPAYVMFVLVYGLTAAHLGAALGCLVAALACSMCYLLPGLRVGVDGRATSSNQAARSSDLEGTPCARDTAGGTGPTGRQLIRLAPTLATF